MSTPCAHCLGACFLALVFFSGCASQQDITSLDHRLAALERHSVEMEKQNQKLKTLFSDDVSAESSSLTRDRQHYAELVAQIQNDEEQIRTLSGRLDEITHALSMQAGAETDANQAQRIDKLAASLAALTKRVAAVEQQLNTKPAASAAVSTPAKATAAAPAATQTPPASAAPAAQAAATPAASSAAPPENDVALYNAAKKNFDAGNRVAARKEFESLLAQYPKSSRANNAQFWIAETYYQEKWYEKAILEYQKVIENYPAGNKRPAALLKQGLSFQNINETSNARLIFKELIKQYPNSEEAEIAKKRVESLP